MPSIPLIDRLFFLYESHGSRFRRDMAVRLGVHGSLCVYAPMRHIPCGRAQMFGLNGRSRYRTVG